MAGGGEEADGSGRGARAAGPAEGPGAQADGAGAGRRRRADAALVRLHGVLEGADDWKSRAFQVFIVALISANVAVMMAETEEGLSEYAELFIAFETASVVVFTIEYAARIVSCRADPRYAGARWAPARFALSPMMLVDLAAILPFYLPLVLIDIRFIRMVRLLRLFSMFKLARYSEPLQTLGSVFRSKAADLVVAFFIFFIVLVFASSLMYYAENEAQPEVFSSIPASMWWGIVTLTTIGYGDTYPVTAAGKAIGAGVAVLGLAVYAIPLGIMASAFTEELRRKRDAEAGRRRRPGPRLAGDAASARPRPPPAPDAAGDLSPPARCPHCGRGLDVGRD